MSLAGGSDSAFCNGAESAVLDSRSGVCGIVMPNIVDRICTQQTGDFCPQKWSNGFGKVQTNGKKGNGINNGLEGNSNAALPQPCVMLYDRKLDFSIRVNRTVGCGLVNLGNTCFLSSTLQCLIHMPPWFNYMMSDHHINTCKMNRNDCFVCMFQRLVKNTLRCHGSAFSPREIVDRLKQICSHMQKGRQEDAHEFLLSLLNGMQASLLYGLQKLDTYSQETTVLCQIFGGYLRSQITCKCCHWGSSTFEHFFNISLDIKNSKSLFEALTAYTRVELLDGENAYRCERCRQPTRAEKCYSIAKAPNVLIIQLKRYSLEEKGHSKLSHHVYFSNVLDLSSFMSEPEPKWSLVYQLHCVLVHVGQSINSGHYFAYVCSENNRWHEMNDEKVREISFEDVKSAQAYMLFFVRKSHDSAQKLHSGQRVCTSDKPGTKHSACTGSRNKFEATTGTSVSNTSSQPHPYNFNGKPGFGMSNSSGVSQPELSACKTSSVKLNGEKHPENNFSFSNSSASVGNANMKSETASGNYGNGALPLKSSTTSRPMPTSAAVTSGSTSLHNASNTLKLSTNHREKVAFKIERPKDRLNVNCTTKSQATATVSKVAVTPSGSSMLNNTTRKLVAYDDESSDQESDKGVEVTTEDNKKSLLNLPLNPSLGSVGESGGMSLKNDAVKETVHTADACAANKPVLDASKIVSKSPVRLVQKACDLESLGCKDREIEKQPVLRRSSSDSKLHDHLLLGDSRSGFSRDLGPGRFIGDTTSQSSTVGATTDCNFVVKPLFNEHNEFVAVDITNGKGGDGGQNFVNSSKSAAASDNSAGPSVELDVHFNGSSCDPKIPDVSVTPNGEKEKEPERKKRHKSKEGSTSRQHKRRKHKHLQDDEKHNSGSSNDMEYVWVERTLETIKQKKYDDKEHSKSLKNIKKDDTKVKNCSKEKHLLELDEDPVQKTRPQSRLSRSRERSSSRSPLRHPVRQDSSRQRSRSRGRKHSKKSSEHFNKNEYYSSGSKSPHRNHSSRGDRQPLEFSSNGGNSDDASVNCSHSRSHAETDRFTFQSRCLL